jgi:ABC-type lipoprotein export system ATPase subunit
MIECRDISKRFGTGRSAQSALDRVSVSFTRGEASLLLGPSGSGKTTLLSILGFLISPSEGQLWLDGCKVNHFWKGQLLRIRRTRIGFVFQQAQLLPFLTLRENLSVVGDNAGIPRRPLNRRIDELLERLGIHDLQHKAPEKLSGGERQRGAIARALLTKPPIVLADEPTAALDWSNGQNVIRLLLEQARVEGSLLITVTHDTRLVPLFDRVLRLDSGQIVPE